MSSKRGPNRTKINITSQTAVSFYIRMFSDRFASLFHLSVLRKKLQIPRKGHQIRGCRFFSSSSHLRAKFEKKRANINQTVQKHRRRNRPKRCSFRHLLPERLRSRYRTQKRRFQGSQGCPRRVPRAPQESPERPQSVPGRSPEHPRSAPGAPNASNRAPASSKQPSGNSISSLRRPPGPHF